MLDSGKHAQGRKMKRMHFAGLVCVVLAFGVTARAQNSLSQFVITGDTAKKIHDTTTINLATAERITQACERLAAKEGVGISRLLSVTRSCATIQAVIPGSWCSSVSSPIPAVFP
jgi:hypothetical protein